MGTLSQATMDLMGNGYRTGGQFTPILSWNWFESLQFLWPKPKQIRKVNWFRLSYKYLFWVYSSQWNAFVLFVVMESKVAWSCLFFHFLRIRFLIVEERCQNWMTCIHLSWYLSAYGGSILLEAYTCKYCNVGPLWVQLLIKIMNERLIMDCCPKCDSSVKVNSFCTHIVWD